MKESINTDKGIVCEHCSSFLCGRSDRTRSCSILFANGKKYLICRRFRLFLTLSARKHILSGTLTSTVSVYSVCGCGINCGQAKHPECSSRRIRGAFCRLYGNSYSAKSQGLSQNKFCPAVEKEKRCDSNSALLVIRTAICYNIAIVNKGR